MRPSFWSSQRSDYIAKRGKRLIDALALFEAFTRRTCDHHSLTTCQVNQVELSNLDLLLVSLVRGDILPHLLQNDDEDGVGATTDIIHLRRCLNSRLLPTDHQVVSFTRSANSPFREAFDEDATLGILSDLQA